MESMEAQVTREAGLRVGKYIHKESNASRRMIRRMRGAAVARLLYILTCADGRRFEPCRIQLF